jgi:hemolysin activation/secretion protein
MWSFRQMMFSERSRFFLQQSRCLCLAILLAFSLQSAAAAQEFWKIDNLPASLVGGIEISKDVDVYNAANSLVHILENYGYPLATVHIGSGSLIANLGRVDEIAVRGLDQKTTSLAESYLKLLIGAAPTIEKVDHVTGLINDIPGLTAGLQFDRLSEDGSYAAVLTGSQITQSGSLSFYNTPTEDFSGREAVLHQEFYSVALGGDILRFELAGSDQKSQTVSLFGQLSYQAPLTNNGTFAEARVSHFDAGSDFNFRSQNDGDTTSSAAALMLGHQFKRSVGAAQTGYVELDYRVDDDNQTGQRENGVARASWFQKNETDLGNTFSYGLTVSGGRSFAGDSETFGSLRGGLGFITWLPAVSDHTEMLIELSGQLGSKDQPSFELFSFGGQNKQRGFAPFEYAGSSGLNITFELGQTYHTDSKAISGITPYIFLDGSYMANQSDETSIGRPENVRLVGTGLGGRLSLTNGFSLNGWLASPIFDSEDSDRSLGPVFYLQAQVSW